ncbi:hypothetical protein E2C01_094053 [Portunus trituberculatus]|uniref:Uncharacterized protein n=1 Tax=Portunus trituberculatus TaxID=210409 RepID=A0A5B7JW70_PORTR|nr:hypothetical protein [Portunus trituberculatus]
MSVVRLSPKIHQFYRRCPQSCCTAWPSMISPECFGRGGGGDGGKAGWQDNNTESAACPPPHFW